MGVFIEQRGLTRLGMTVAYIAEGVRPGALSRLSTNLAVIQLADTLRRFDAGVDPNGRPWKYLSPVTLRRRYERTKAAANRKGVFTFAILRDKGILRLSVSPARATPMPPGSRREAVISSSAEGAVRRYGAWGFAIGTSLVYAGPHQFGRARMSGTVRAHVRRHRSRDVSARKNVGRALGIAHVRAHQTTLPAIPARPFLGVSRESIRQSDLYMGDWLVKEAP